ncbi:alpha/beta hydrolase [Nocardia nova]|nr:alpha/beta hydrolase [Nocardia nova]
MNISDMLLSATNAFARPAATAVRTIPAWPQPIRRALAGPPIRVDGAELDLDTQLLLRIQRLLPDRPPATPADVPQLRDNSRRTARLVAGRPPEVRAYDITVAGAAGRLRARCYRPGSADAIVVYLHGGGWVHGDLETHDAPCRALAHASGMVVVAVEYRLAPEHRHPAAVLDALAAFRDIHRRRAEFGLPGAPVVIGGDSAGGNLAAVACQQLSREHDPRPAAQLLIYPATDLATRHPSHALFRDGFFLTRASIEFFEHCYLAPGSDRSDPCLSPLRTPDASGLPPAVVITAGFDPLRDEGELYADRLAAAGVPVTTRRFDGYVHGFFNNLATCSAAVGEIATLLRARTLAT